VVHGRKAPTSTGRDLLGDRAAQEPPEGMATRASTGRAPEVRGRVGSMGPRGRDPEVRDRKAPTSTGRGRSNGQRANDLLGLEVRAAQAGSAPPARRLASVWAIRGLEVRVLEGHGLEGRGRAVPGRVGLGRVLTPARPGVRTASRALPGASGAPMSRRHAGRAQLEPARGHGLAKTRGRALKASWAMASVSRDPRRPLRRGRAARRVRVRAAQPALRYGRQYFREISGDGVNFGGPIDGNATLAWSRVLDTDEVLVAMNLSGSSRNDAITVDRNLTTPGAPMENLLQPGTYYPVQECGGRAFVRVPLPAHGLAVLKKR
jgi:hypothetical protein